MLLISHRANIDGPNKDRDNNPVYVKEVLDLGYECEIDLWVENGEKLHFGHDEPKYKISQSDFINMGDRLWVHAKNKLALHWLIRKKTGNKFHFNFFWHDKDEYTVTSKGFVWCYPSKEIKLFGINLMPEYNNFKKNELKNCVGICSDFIGKYK